MLYKSKGIPKIACSCFRVLLSVLLVSVLIPPLCWAEGSEEEVQNVDNEDSVEAFADDVVYDYQELEADVHDYMEEEFSAQLNETDDSIEVDLEDGVMVAQSTDSGTFSTGVTWSWDADTKTMTFGGNGEIPEAAFDDCGDHGSQYAYAKLIETIVMGDGVTEVKNLAFGECEKLVNFTLGKNVRKLGTYVFWDCGDSAPSLTNFVIPRDSVLEEIGNGCFYKSSFASSIYLPDTLKKIGNSAFVGATNLSEIVSSQGSGHLPPNLESIGQKAFNGTNLSGSIYLPDSLKTIGDSAFEGASNLSGIVSSQGSGHLPSNIESIGQKAFYGTNLSGDIAAPDNCEIGANAFPDAVRILQNKVYPTSGVDSATGISWEVSTEGDDKVLKLNGTGTVPQNDGVASWLEKTDPDVYTSKNITKIVIGEGITAIGNKAFYSYSSSLYWPNVRSVSVSASVQSFGQSAFLGLQNLKTFEIAPGSQLTTITAATTGNPRGCWALCTSLERLDLSSTKLTAWTGEIANCSSLSELVFPSTLTSIGASAFQNATSLKHIVIPPSVTSIDSVAFNYAAIEEAVLSSPCLVKFVPEGFRMIYCGITEEQFDQDELNNCKEFWTGSAYDISPTISFQGHTCSTDHVLTSGESVDLTCSVCGASAGVSVEKDGYDYNVEITAKNLASHISNPVTVALPELSNKFAYVDGKLYMGCDIASGVHFSKSGKVETLKADNGLPVELAFDALNEAPGLLSDHEIYNDSSAIKAALLDVLQTTEEGAVFTHVHMVAGDEEFAFSDFPTNTLTFELPYPVDNPSAYNYKVAHMIDSTDHNTLGVGDIEILDCTPGMTGVRVSVNSLSPFAISYDEIPSESASQSLQTVGGMALAQTGDDMSRQLELLAVIVVLGVISLAILEARRRREVVRND